MTTELTAIRKKLEKKLKEERYIHTLGVMYTAASMAMRHGADVQKAMTAGLLHDCGKYCDVNEQILLCRKHHIKLSDAELEVPALIHARLGAYFAEYEYGITDSEILDAITYHTTGRPAMTMIEKIVYLADYIEPGRKKIPGLAEVRTAAFDDIDTAVCMTAESTLAFLKRAGRKVDPMTEKTCQYYKNKAGNIPVKGYRTIRKGEQIMEQSKLMARLAYQALDDKKGEDIQVIDISQVSVLADYFIIANGNSESQVRALVDNVEEELSKAGYEMKQREGYGSGNWVLMDFGEIIVHVFDKENRLFYDLERIWRDGKHVDFSEL